jgi:hypothetical protein
MPGWTDAGLDRFGLDRCRVGQMPGWTSEGWTNPGWTDKIGLDRGWIDLSRWYGLYTSCTQVVYKVGRFAVLWYARTAHAHKNPLSDEVKTAESQRGTSACRR